MKDLIVIIGTAVLGCMIFTMICGDHGSLKAASEKQFQKNMKAYEEMNGP